MPGMPADGPNSQSQDGPQGDDSGLDVNVNVNAGGAQLPGMPGIPGMPGMPGAAGMPGMPGMPGSSSGSGGDVVGTGSRSGSAGGGGIEYGTGNDPFGGLGTPGAGGTGGMTTAERRAVLDARLEEGYAVFDGVVLSERERAQREADQAGSSVMGTGGAGGGDGGEGDEGGFGDLAPGVIIASSSDGSPGGGPGAPIGGGEGRPPSANQAAFPVPEDIPSGNDDDVVARQLREAAQNEPDPELREKLWDEYRKYTGLPSPE